MDAHRDSLRRNRRPGPPRIIRRGVDLSRGRLAERVPADPALEIVSLRWERVQLVIRARRGSFGPDDGRRFRLERASGRAAMSPTRAWSEGDDLLLRFNVMQGPHQDPLARGRWILTFAPDGGSRRRPDPDRRPVRRGCGPRRRHLRGRGWPVPLGRPLRPSRRPRPGSLALVVSLQDTRGRARCGARVRGGALGCRLTAARPSGRRFRRLLRVARRPLRAQRPADPVHLRLARRPVRNLKLVYDRMVARGLDREYELLTLFARASPTRRSLRDRIRLPLLLARADVIVIDDYQPVIYQVDVDPDVRIIQLWHASGAFKTVGYSRVGKPGGPRPVVADPQELHATRSSAPSHDVPFYAEAFGIPESRVVPTGIPRMDRFFDEARAAAGRGRRPGAFPETRGRMTILFAPTFRGDGAADASYDLERLDYAALHALAVERDAVVIIRMHPFVRDAARHPRGVRATASSTDRRPTIDVNDLLFAVDLLITDYSSIVFEYSTLGRPMLFFAYDLEEYIAIARLLRAVRDVRARADRADVRRSCSTPSGATTTRLEKVADFAAPPFRPPRRRSTDRVIDQVILGR